MSGPLSDKDIEFLVNILDNESYKYIDIPDGNISDVGDEDINDASVEIKKQISVAQSEAVAMELVHLTEKQKGDK